MFAHLKVIKPQVVIVADYLRTLAGDPSGMVTAIQNYKASGAQVIYLEDTPDPEKVGLVPACLAKNTSNVQKCALNRFANDTRLDGFPQRKNEAAAVAAAGAIVIDPTDWFCTRDDLPTGDQQHRRVLRQLAYLGDLCPVAGPADGGEAEAGDRVAAAARFVVTSAGLISRCLDRFMVDSFVVRLDELASAATAFRAQADVLSLASQRLDGQGADCGDASLTELLSRTVRIAQFVAADLSRAMGEHASKLTASLSAYIASDQLAAALLDAQIDDGAGR